MTQITKELRFFGRRKGKGLKQGRERLISELLPKLTPTMPTNNTLLDVKTIFGISPREVWLEIGFGGGEHLANQALNNPDIGIIGAEPFINGVASLLAHLNGSHRYPVDHTDLEDGRVDNVRIYADDVRDLFKHLPDKCFNRIFVLYPDPWPKARHEGRRFFNPINLGYLNRLLSDDGQLRLATDVQDYADWALQQTIDTGYFTQINEDVRTPPTDWIQTRYEIKGIKAGRIPTYFIFKKTQKNEKNA